MNLAENLEKIQQRMRAACARAGRHPESVALLAVTKSHPPETVAAAAQLGLKLFGENKVQEARAKIPLCPGKLRWHFIGHLQSNKCRDAVEGEKHRILRRIPLRHGHADQNELRAGNGRDELAPLEGQERAHDRDCVPAGRGAAQEAGHRFHGVVGVEPREVAL